MRYRRRAGREATAWLRVGQRGAELGREAVLDPVRVPPFDRVHRQALEQRGEVQVVAAGEAGLAGLADRLAALDATRLP